MLELGPGTKPHRRTRIGLDINHPKGCGPIDAGVDPWPLEDSSVTEVFSSHFMEHIPRGTPLIHVMTEAHRVLKPGGTFTMICPLVGYTNDNQCELVASWHAYADPTHVNLWWFPEAVMYFCEGPFHPEADYGYPIWEALGPRIGEAQVSKILEAERRTPATSQSFWAVRGGWEGVARLVRP
jgi:hypothetical protein